MSTQDTGGYDKWSDDLFSAARAERAERNTARAARDAGNARTLCLYSLPLGIHRARVERVFGPPGITAGLIWLRLLAGEHVGRQVLLSTLHATWPRGKPLRALNQEEVSLHVARRASVSADSPARVAHIRPLMLGGAS